MTVNQKWLVLDIWKYDVLVLWGGTIEAALPLVQGVVPEATAPDSGVVAYTWMPPGSAACIWVAQLDPASLAHEFLHVVMPLMYDRGLRSGPSTVEAYCYTLEALMRAALAAPSQREPIPRLKAKHVSAAATRAPAGRRGQRASSAGRSSRSRTRRPAKGRAPR